MSERILALLFKLSQLLVRIVKVNRKIKIMCGLSDSRIYYEDLSVTKEKEQIENKEINDKRQKSQTDI